MTLLAVLDKHQLAPADWRWSSALNDAREKESREEKRGAGPRNHTRREEPTARPAAVPAGSLRVRSERQMRRAAETCREKEEESNTSEVVRRPRKARGANSRKTVCVRAENRRSLRGESGSHGRLQNCWTSSCRAEAVAWLSSSLTRNV